MPRLGRSLALARTENGETRNAKRYLLPAVMLQIEFSVQRCDTDPQHTRGFFSRSLVELESHLDVLPLPFADEVIQWLADTPLGIARRFENSCFTQNMGWQI